MPSKLTHARLQEWVVAMAAAMAPPMARGWVMAQGAMAQVLTAARWAPLGRQVISTVHRCTLCSNQEGLQCMTMLGLQMSHMRVGEGLAGALKGR